MHSAIGRTQSGARGIGVRGQAFSSIGQGIGVLGEALSPAGIAVYGNNGAASGDPVGVQGVTSSTDRGIGVRGGAAASTGTGIGVLGEAISPNGAAGVFNAIGGGDILVGIGFNAFTAFRVNANGNVFASAYNVGGADFAESLAVAGDRMRYRPGDILVIDATGVSRVKLADSPYSSLVAGIYSSKPGLLASSHKMNDPDFAKEVPLAVVGVVPCKVTAENGPINAGDLLVSSSTPDTR